MGNFKHVVQEVERVSEELVQAASQISTATLHEAYNQNGAFCSDIRPIRLGMKGASSSAMPFFIFPEK